MKNLKEMRLVSSHEYKLLEDKFHGVSKQLFENQVYNARFRDKHSNCHSEKSETICNDLALLFPKSI